MASEKNKTQSKQDQTSKSEKHQYEAEVSKLLHIVAHSLYSEREIFLRELIANASDACSQLRYTAIEQPDILTDSNFKVVVRSNSSDNTITIEDNGIGMNKEALINNLGTIARSGTSMFLEQLSGDNKNDINAIGQFGVGFYSAFMVSDEVHVFSKQAGESQGWQWSSFGGGEYTITPSKETPEHGVKILLKLKDDAGEFSKADRLKNIVKKWSNHIQIPVFVGDEQQELIQANEANALWLTPKKDITQTQYNEFYHSISFGISPPLMTIHFKAEGVLQYAALLFIPGEAPFDLFTEERKSKLSLHVNRVFITSDIDALLPAWLRFVRGVVDTEDLPLNVSREILQKAPQLSKMQTGIVKRILSEIEKFSKDTEEYETFWQCFGAVLKEGLYERYDNSEMLLSLCRFKSSNNAGWRSLDQYIDNMKDGQEQIFYVSADTEDAARLSPQLEMFHKKGIEVLLMTDPIDEFWNKAVTQYRDKTLTSITQNDIDIDNIKPSDDADDDDNDEQTQLPDDKATKLTTAMQAILGASISNVRVSKRLANSPVCLVAAEGGQDLRLQRILSSQSNDATQSYMYKAPVLEINPSHALIKKLADMDKPDEAICHLLFQQANIQEGNKPESPTEFAKHINILISQALEK